MPSSSSSPEGITELNLTGEELKYLDEIEENQEHNIGIILPVPNLSESPRPPAPAVNLEKVNSTSAIFWLCQTCPSHRGLPPRRLVLAIKVKTSLASRVYK
ncbi:hypothetical protein J6590_016960 [Homalodisca vitripennis]|nr:hypothetical protein J6590_016960 [Homalodisca vitripennis]